MSYEKLCEHPNVEVRWNKVNETDGEPPAEVRRSNCLLVIGAGMWIGKAWDAKCQSYIPDTDAAAQKAFYEILSHKINKVEEHAT